VKEELSPQMVLDVRRIAHAHRLRVVSVPRDLLQCGTMAGSFH